MRDVRLRWSVLILAAAAVGVAAVLRFCLGGGQDARPLSPAARRVDELRRRKDVEALAKEAAGTSTEVAWRAVAALGRLGPEAAERIRPHFRDSRAKVREKAATAFADTGSAEDDKALADLGSMARVDESANVRASAVSALGRLAAFEEMDALLAAMDDPDELVRRRAGDSAQSIACVRVGYRAEDPPEQRRAAIESLRAQWERDREGAARYWTALRQKVKANQVE